MAENEDRNKEDGTGKAKGVAERVR